MHLALIHTSFKPASSTLGDQNFVLIKLSYLKNTDPLDSCLQGMFTLVVLQ